MTTEESPSAQSEATSSAQSEAASSAQIEAMGNRVEAVERQVAALTATLSATRSTRRLLTLGYVIFFCVFGFLFYRLVMDFQKKESLDQLVAKVQQRLQDTTLEKLKRQTMSLVDTARPVLTDAFYAQAKADASKYAEALEDERDMLMVNLQERMERQLQDHYKAILQRHEAVLKEEFPDLNDEQLNQMASNIEKATQQLIDEYYVERMRTELEDMFKTWDEYPIADPPGPRDIPLEEELIGLLMEILTSKLSGAQSSLLTVDAAE